MARRTISEIEAELLSAIHAKSIRNVRYKDICQEVGRIYDDSRLSYRGASKDLDPDWQNSPRAEQEQAHKRGLPFSVLHVSGYWKKNDKDKDKWSWLQARILVAEQFLAVSNALVVARQFIVKGREPAEPKAPPANSGTCQCCGRIIGDSVGVIAHHGYKRPRPGVQTSSCYGALFLSFEISRDRLGWMIDYVIKPTLERHRDYLVKLGEPEVKVPGPILKRAKDDPAYHPDFPFTHTHQPVIGTDHAEYAKWHAIAKAECERDIKWTEGELARQQKRYDGWKQTRQPPADLAPAKNTVTA